MGSMAENAVGYRAGKAGAAGEVDRETEYTVMFAGSLLD
jgi:hypothetical protein